MRKGGSQSAHNDYINIDADVTVFLFYHRVGQFTMEELSLAHEAFLKKDKPNVFVFFKAVDGGEPDPCLDIKNCINRVFEDYGHYYQVFSDVDTVKLELLKCFADMLPGNGELIVKDRKVYLDKEAVNGIAARNVFAYQNNRDLKRLKEERDALLQRMLEASKQGDAEEALRASIQLDKAQKAYHQMEKDILGALLFFHEQKRKGRKADPLVAEALRQLERGNIAGAKGLLPQEALDREAESCAQRRALAEEQLGEEEDRLIERTRIWIRILRLDVGNPDRFSEIEHAYDSASEAATARKAYAFLYEFASFLNEQKNYPKGILTAEKLSHLYALEEAERVDDSDRAALLNLLGLLYNSDNDYRKAESVYTEALKIARKQYAAEPTAANEAKVAMSCNNLAILYSRTGKPAEAEELYQKALAIRRRLAAEVSRTAYEPKVAVTAYNLGCLYQAQKKGELARQCFAEAKKIAEAYKDVDPICRKIAESV